jgi:DNA-formamidopyrimidine glycosylase
MPEGPELRCSRDALREILHGQKILGFKVGATGRYIKKVPEGFFESNNKLPLTITSIDTHGKFMWWTLSTDGGEQFFMHCTYGMSGAWQTIPSKHTCFIVEYSDGNVYFNDPRHFGTIKFVHKSSEHKKKLATLGPCILGSQIEPEIFAEKMLRKPSRTIAEALMDQASVAGVGNYIKAECLYRAGISPWRQVSDISPEEYVGLCEHTLAVAQESYNSQGASIYTYKNPNGEEGEMQFSFRVYSQKSCPRGHLVVNQETPEGRTSWWCAECQT